MSTVDRKGARKTSGSYYTPRVLVDVVLRTTLQPLIIDRVKAADPVEALLSLKVCDTACGGTAFLTAAVDRLAAWVAFLRTNEVNPSEEALAAARRDVVERCMYGVDLNPIAVDLTRAALWTLALANGKPNPFISHRIRHGNALIGATPALLKRGIPDAAFTPIEGDDKKVARELKRRNATERSVQATPEGALF